MKKMLAVLSSVALLLTMLSVMMTTVYAAAPITYTVESVQHTGTIAQDEELTVNISSSELASFYGAALTVNYDSTQLELMSAEEAGWLGNMMWSPVDTSTAGQIVVDASSMFQAFSSAADEVFLTITFKALADIETDVALTLTDATVTQEFSMMPGQTATAEAADVVDGGFVIADDSTTTIVSEPSDTTTYIDTTTETAEATDTTDAETTTELVTSSTGETTDTTTTAVMTYTVQTVEHSGAVATDEEVTINVYGSEIASIYRTAFTVTYDDTQFEYVSYEKAGFLADARTVNVDAETAGEIVVDANNGRNALSCAADDVVLTLVFKALTDIEEDAVVGLSSATVTLSNRPGSTAYDAATVDGGVKILPIISGTSVTDTTDTTGESTTTDTMPDPTETILSTTAVTSVETTVSTDASDTTSVATTEATTTAATTVATTTEVTTTATETETTAAQTTATEAETTVTETETSASVTESTTETESADTTTLATVTTTAADTEILFIVSTVERAQSQMSVGTLVEVPLSATVLESFSTMSMTVLYDSDKLQYVACSKATEDTWFENGDVTEETAGQLTLEVSSGFGPFGGSLTANGGEFATLIFKVKGDLVAGDILSLTAKDPVVADWRGNEFVADCISGAIVVAPETTTSAEDTTTGTTASTDGSTTVTTANTTTTPTTAPTETSTSTDSTTESTTSTTVTTDSTAASTETTESTTVTETTTTTTIETTDTTTATESSTTAVPTETTASSETATSTSATESTTAPTDAAPQKGNGDTDGNGTVNIQDAVQCYYHVNGKIVLAEDAQARADVSDPIGSLTIRDAVTVYYLVNGKISTL